MRLFFCDYMQNLIVIKLGGSSITKKADNKFEMNEEILKQSAVELASVLKKNPKLKIALVCGVGPFGHTNVKEYDLNNGIKTKRQEEGTQKTIQDCDFVADKTIEALEKCGLKTEHVPGYLVCRQDNKKVVSFDVEPYKEALGEGKIPLTTGNMVKDRILKWSPMSGDVVVAQLCKQLRPDKVIMGTDVEGIFTADPKIDKKAELIERITKENVEEVLEKAGESKSVDVTGGMKGKLEKLAQTLDGVPAEIFNLLKEGNLEKVLEGKEIKSTKLLL